VELPPGDVTILLARIRSGEQDALTELIPLVYRELRRLAGHFLREERVGHTLQPTALVHEAYLCLVGQDRANWQNRAQFMAIASQIMRRILLRAAAARQNA
jgi:RNA polymerase sigma-70 factor (ECF subfamily)